MKEKKIINKLEISAYRITFTYETFKGYYREQVREINAISKDQAKEVFKDWSKSIRTMVNVKILAITEIENTRRAIEI